MDRDQRIYQVKDLAQLANLSVRTLHHYDHIGLLRPTARTDAGYRLYTGEDLLRLQQILLHRERGLKLDEIRRLLDDPGFDLRQALLEQRQHLSQQARRTAAQLKAIDAALAALHKEQDMSGEELFQGFDPSQHEEEAQQRWGHTQAWRQSQRRTAAYTPEDWARYQQQSQANYQALAQAMDRGHAPTSPHAMALAEAHRQLIHDWFYDCDHATHRGLADMYQADARFQANIDKHREGLSAYLSAAIHANATAHRA